MRFDPRRSITARLVLAFLGVSLLPIGILAYLSARESKAGAEELEGAERHGETLLGLPTATIELAVAAFSFVLGIAAAVYVARTFLRPLRELEGAIGLVEAGDLECAVEVESADEVGRLSASFNRMVHGLRRERLVRDLFGLYVSPEVARTAIQQEGRLEGTLVRGTILFADIRDFTALGETLAPADLLSLLNRYFDRMAAVVAREGGLVNKFGGDSLLAVFGTPLNPDEGHPAAAVRAALGMQIALADLNGEQERAAAPTLAIGIGLATGDVVAGNVGGERRLEYTVIGDPVNLAARLQALTKELAEPILAGAETAREAAGSATFRSVGEVEVRGKARPVEVVAVESGPSSR